MQNHNPKPSPVRMVLAVGGKATSNGTDTAPAVITRVWNDQPGADGAWLVNATVFPDCGDPALASSAYLHADEASARASLTHESQTALYWPPRV